MDLPTPKTWNYTTNVFIVLMTFGTMNKEISLPRTRLKENSISPQQMPVIGQCSRIKSLEDKETPWKMTQRLLIKGIGLDSMWRVRKTRSLSSNMDLILPLHVCKCIISPYPCQCNASWWALTLDALGNGKNWKGKCQGSFIKLKSLIPIEVRKK
jgi:hypothetical protein